jgi:tetratricopeptide (TPR) repeat protein
LAASIAIVAVSFSLYLNAIGNDFMFDDLGVVVRDLRVTEGQFGRLLTEGYWGEGHQDLLYRPLVSLSFAVNWAMSNQPWAFRVPNLLLHIGVCVLVLMLTREVFGPGRGEWAAIVAAGVFALHPIHTEPLNTIVGRSDLAVTMFMLAAALLWWRDACATPPAGLRRPILAALCFAAALLCKESGITLIGIIIVLDFWHTRSRTLTRESGWWRRRLVRGHIPMLAVTLGYLALRFAVLGALTTSGAPRQAPSTGQPLLARQYENPIDTPPEEFPPDARLALVRWGTPIAAFGKAANLMIAPVGLLHDYSMPVYPPVTHPGEARLWIGVAWMLVAIGGIAVSFRRTGAAIVALAFALIPYSVTSNFVILIGTVFGERLLYAPSVGACMMIGLLAAKPLASLNLTNDRARRTPARDDGIAMAVILVAASAWFAYATIDRNRDWRNVEALVASVPDDGSASFKVLDAYADREIATARAHREGGDETKAREALSRAIEYARRSYVTAPKAWGSGVRLADALNEMGRKNEAYLALAEAMEKGAGSHEPALLLMAALTGERGEYANQLKCLEYLVHFRPGVANYQNNLAVAYLRKPDYAPAVEHARIAHGLAPDHPGIAETLARALLESGSPDQALPHARAAVRGLPGIGEVHLTLVRVLDAMGQTQEAARAACDALALIPASDEKRPDLRSRCEPTPGA